MSSVLDFRKEYRSFMVKYADEYTFDDLIRLKYVLKDDIPAGKMEQLDTVLNLFSQLEQKGLVGPNNFDYLLDLVETINRPHLLEMLKNFVIESKVQRMRQKIRNFRSTGGQFGSRCYLEQYGGIISRRMAF